MRVSSPAPSSLTPTTPPGRVVSAGESRGPVNGSGGAQFRPFSTVSAAQIVQARAKEDEEVSQTFSTVDTAVQVASVHGAINSVSRRLEAHAQSQAPANVRADAVFVAPNKVTSGDGTPSGASAHPVSRAVAKRQAKRELERSCLWGQDGRPAETMVRPRLSPSLPQLPLSPPRHSACRSFTTGRSL